MYFPEKQLYFWIFLYSFMARKIVLIWTILGLFFIILNYHFLGQKQPVKEQNEITIFTLDTLANIHAKMILWENGTVIFGSSKKLSEKEKNIIHDSDIIIDTLPLNESNLSPLLQSYRGTYLTIPMLPRTEILQNNTSIVQQIELIRDAIVSKDRNHPGYYYDNAGGYIHLIENLYESIQNRLWKYHKSKFITLGGDFESFVEKFWLKEYHFKRYDTIKDFTSEKWIKDMLKKENINHVFVFFPLADWEVRHLEKTYNVSVYRLPQIEEDTSGWWYLRYLEKVSDQFVRAFDTYD